MRMRAYLLWIALVFSDTMAQLTLKMSAIKAASTAWTPNSLMLCAYGFYVLSFFIWMQILKRVRLFIALSAATVVYATIAVSAHFLFGEKITGQVIIGTALIAAGLFILGWKKQRNEDEAAG